MRENGQGNGERVKMVVPAHGLEMAAPFRGLKMAAAVRVQEAEPSEPSPSRDEPSGVRAQGPNVKPQP